MRLKEAAGAGDIAARQRYASALHQFVREHPGHRRARLVWDELELEHALELASQGFTDQAVERLDAIMARRSSVAGRAREAAAVLRQQQRVTDEEIESIERGMSAGQVQERIGPPPRGWKRTRGDYESWYYRGEAGGIVSIHFRNRVVIAVEVQSRE